MSTDSCRRGALGDILDRWIARIEDGLIDAGADEDSPDFDAKVLKRMDQDLTAFTRGNAPEDMGRALRTVFRLKQEG